MTDQEVRGGGEEERGVLVKEVSKEDLKEAIKYTREKEKIKRKWEKRLVKVKFEFRIRLVGESQENLKELNKILHDGQEKLNEIKKLSSGEQKRALDDLAKDQEKRINQFIDKIKTEAVEINDGGAEKLAGSKEKTRQIWNKMLELENLEKKLGQELKPRFGQPNLDSIWKLEAQLTNGYNQIIAMVDDSGNKDLLEIRTYWEKEMKNKIDQLRLKNEGGEKVNYLASQLEVLKIKERGMSLKSDDLLGMIEEIFRAQANEEISKSEASKLTAEVKEMGARLDQETQKSQPKQTTENVLGGIPKKDKQDIEKQDKMEEAGVYTAMGNEDDTTNNINSLIRKFESDPSGTDYEVETMKMVEEFAKGNYAEVFQVFRQWIASTGSPMRHTELLKDAKKEIALRALERITREGSIDTKRVAVLQEDVEAWVMEQMNMVVGSGDGVTGYSSRQYLGEVSGILVSGDLDFRSIIKSMQGEIYTPDEFSGLHSDSGNLKALINKARDEGKLITLTRGGSGITKPILIDSEIHERLTAFMKGPHLVKSNDDFKDTISAAIGSYSLFGAHKQSGGIEDMVRVGSHFRTESFGSLLEMESVGKDVAGRVGFYEVAVDDRREKATGKRKLLNRNDLDKDCFVGDGIIGLSSAEMSQGTLTMKIKTAKGEVIEIKPEELSDWLRVETESLKLSTGDVVDVLNQARFAVGALHTNEKVRVKFEKEALRAAMMFRMGLTDLDGEVNWSKVQELVVKRYGDGAKLSLENSQGELDYLNRDAKKIRMKLVLEKVGSREMKVEKTREEHFYLNDDKKEGLFVLGGWGEDIGRQSLDLMMGEYKMMFELAKGFWQVTGLSVGHWDKDHSGDSKDWHRKIIHFIQYCQMYGIGVPHLRQYINLDYHDFITRRKSDFIPALFGKHTSYGKNGKELKNYKKGKGDASERSSIISMLVTDRDGYVMSRQKMLDIFGHYRELELESEGRGNDFIKNMLLEKLALEHGETKAKIMLNKHWKYIIDIDYGKFIENREGMRGGEERGLSGLYWWAKKQYRYSDLNWGKGNKPGDKTWSERWYKESQYLLSADKFRGAIMTWLAGKPESVSAFLEATSAAGWYGQSDQNRKNPFLLKGHREVFTTNKKIGGMDTIWHDPESLIALDRTQDEWDDSMRYGKVKVGPGRCLGKEQRGIGPFNSNEYEGHIDAMLRAGKITAMVAQEMKWKNELGEQAEKINLILETTPILNLPGVKHTLKTLNTVLFGKQIREKIIDLGWIRFALWPEKHWPGLLGFLWKYWKKWWADTWAVRHEILRGGAQALGEQGKNLLKN